MFLPTAFHLQSLPFDVLPPRLLLIVTSPNLHGFGVVLGSYHGVPKSFFNLLSFAIAEMMFSDFQGEPASCETVVFRRPTVAVECLVLLFFLREGVRPLPRFLD
jgi:hypothetical protein